MTRDKSIGWAEETETRARGVSRQTLTMERSTAFSFEFESYCYGCEGSA